MDFSSSSMELPKSSSALPSELQRPICMHSSMPSNNKIQQDEDERDPRFMQLLKENLSCFWKRQKEEILHSDPKRKHELPISRIRRIMKSNDQVKMVSAHSTVLFSKAIEMFILELTLRAWMQADQVKCRTLKRYHFARAIRDEELFDFLSDIVPLQTYKNQFQVEEANDSQGNEFYAAYQMIQPNNIPLQYQFQVEEANDVQGNKFRLANQMVQLQNIPLYQFKVGWEENDGQGNEFDPAYQIVQPSDIPCQFQVQKKANDGQENEFQARELKISSEAFVKGFDLLAYQMVQPNNIPVEKANDVQGNKFHLANRMVQPHLIPVEGAADDGQENEFHPAYQMVQPDNIPCQFQVQKKANDCQGNEFQARKLKISSEAFVKGFDFPAYQMVQPNNIPDLPAYQIVQPNNIPCQYQVQEANDGQGNEFHPAYQLVQPNNIPKQFQVEEDANGAQGNEFHLAYEMVQPNNIPASFISTQGIPAPLMPSPLINLSPETEFIVDGFLMDNKEGDVN